MKETGDDERDLGLLGNIKGLTLQKIRTSFRPRQFYFSRTLFWLKKLLFTSGSTLQTQKKSICHYFFETAMRRTQFDYI